MLTKNKKQLLVFPLFALGFMAMPMSLHAEEQDSIQTNPIEQVVIRSYVPPASYRSLGRAARCADLDHEP